MSLASVDTAELRKARGAFFTPLPLCRYVVDWAIRDGSEQVLEPSCGDAAFLLAAGERFRQLGRSPVGQMSGVELHPESARRAQSLLAASGHGADVTIGDFFSVDPEPRFDVAIGNPPYIRYLLPRGRAESAFSAVANVMRILAPSSGVPANLGLPKSQLGSGRKPGSVGLRAIEEDGGDLSGLQEELPVRRTEDVTLR